MTEELIKIIKEIFEYHLIVWYDGEHYQICGTKQEFYKTLYDLRERILKEL